MIVTAVVLLAISVVKAYDLVVALTNGGPGIATEVPAKFVMDNLFEPPEHRPRHRRLDRDAGHRRSPCSRPGSTSQYFRAARREAGMMIAPHAPCRADRAARKPQAADARAALGHLCLPRRRRSVLPAAALRHGHHLAEDDDEIRLGRSSPCPTASTITAWSRPGRAACTGLDCDGIASASGTRCSITVPSVDPLDRGRRAQRLCAVVLAAKGANILFAVLLLGAFLPYQVFLYPLVRVSRASASTTRCPASSSSTSSSACR